MEPVDLEGGSSPDANSVKALNDYETTSDPPGGHGDQLPSVEEYKAQAGITNTSRGSSKSRSGCLKWLLLIGVPLVLAVIAVSVGVVLAKDDSFNQAVNGSGPDSSGGSSSRVDDVAEFVVAMGWSAEAAVKSPGTPQWEAAEWIADVDLAKLQIDDSVEFKQRYIMAVFYFALDGVNWPYQLKFLSKESICDWYDVWQSGITGVQVGVSCGNGNAAMEIFVPKNKLRGTIPQEIGLMDALVEINLYENEIRGNLPVSMKRLTNLRALTLHDNKLDGGVPDIFTDMRLTLLNLANNNITGELPTSLYEMSSLLTLNLSDNDIEADIGYFSLLTSLQAIFLQSNQIYGELLDSLLTQWSSMEVLDVSDNFMVGPIPAAVFHHPSLVIVDLHNNQLSGALQINDQSGDSNIVFLALQENQLNGAIPADVAFMSQLSHLDLASNMFSEAIPESIFLLTNLRYLSLAYNKLLQPGVISESIGGLTNLVDLLLKETNRFGPIPSSIGMLSNLVMLDLDSNELSEQIPESLGGLSKLTYVFLQRNKLTGGIPQSFSNLQSLHTLLLNNNTLTGQATPICSAQLPALDTFVGDCVRGDQVGFPVIADEIELECPCCTLCCSDESTSCNGLEWYGELDPIWQYKYARDAYRFNEDSIVVPVENFENPSLIPNEDGGTDFIPVPPEP